jgi:hypothetical protein
LKRSENRSWTRGDSELGEVEAIRDDINIKSSSLRHHSRLSVTIDAVTPPKDVKTAAPDGRGHTTRIHRSDLPDCGKRLSFCCESVSPPSWDSRQSRASGSEEPGYCLSRNLCSMCPLFDGPEVHFMGIEIRMDMEGSEQDGATNQVKDLKASILLIGQATISKLLAKLCAYARLYVQLLMCCKCKVPMRVATRVPFAGRVVSGHSVVSPQNLHRGVNVYLLQHPSLQSLQRSASRTHLESFATIP